MLTSLMIDACVLVHLQDCATVFRSAPSFPLTKAPLHRHAFAEACTSHAGQLPWGLGE